MFTVYLDDMMEDLEALNRRTNLPIRMIHDRPHQQQEELLLEEISQENKKYEERMVICHTREENYNDNSTRNGKQKGKLTKGAKKWTAQFMQKYKAEKEANTAKNQEQTTGNDRTEKDKNRNTKRRRRRS